jgi:hypothetical protein
VEIRRTGGQKKFGARRLAGTETLASIAAPLISRNAPAPELMRR